MIDFFAQLAQHGLVVKPSTVDEHEFKICCIFCMERIRAQDFKFRLGFNTDNGMGHCFKCGWTSRKALLDILRKIGSWDSADEIRAVYFSGETRKRPDPVKLPEGFERLLDIEINDPVFGRAKKYVKKRGITPRQLKLHRIGATVLDKFFSHRIIFPVSLDGKLVGIVGRDWTGMREPKYLNSTGLKAIYNVKPDRYERGTEIGVVTEGVTKAFAVERATDYKICCMALLGNSATELQINLLTRFDEIVMFPDPNMIGMVGFLGVADKLQPLVKRVTMVWPWPNAQADDMSGEEVREVLKARREITPLVRLRLKSELQKRD